MKQILKKILSAFGIYVSKNQKYDALLEQILIQELSANSNCVDVGSHKGEILDLFIKYAPQGKHVGFEPLPHLFKQLKSKYGSEVIIRDCGLSDSCGEKEFTYVKNAEAFSGFRERDYQNRNVDLEVLKVSTCTLDTVVTEENIAQVDLIKIDVEGAELEVLRGSEAVIKSQKPLVVFEHGKGAAEFYKTTPEDVFSFFKKCEMSIYTLDSFLGSKKALSANEFNSCFHNGDDYYFVAGE